MPRLLNGIYAIGSIFHEKTHCVVGNSFEVLVGRAIHQVPRPCDRVVTKVYNEQYLRIISIPNGYCYEYDLFDIKRCTKCEKKYMLRQEVSKSWWI